MSCIFKPIQFWQRLVEGGGGGVQRRLEAVIGTNILALLPPRLLNQRLKQNKTGLILNSTKSGQRKTHGVLQLNRKGRLSIGPLLKQVKKLLFFS